MLKSQFPVLVTKETIVGSIFWILSLEYFVGQAIAQAAWTGAPYSLVNNAVSDLGVTVCETVRGDYLCSPLHNVVNVSFVLAGVFILVGLYFTRTIWPNGRAICVGLLLLALMGIGKIDIGFFPENVNLLLHVLGSLGFICGDIGLIFFWRGLRQSAGRLANVSLILGILGLIGSLFFFPLLILNQGGGAAERLAAYPMILWCAMLGFYFVRNPRYSRTSTSPTQESTRQS